MTRAVIEVHGDFSPAMPRLSRLIENCGYNPEAHIMAFRLWEKGVIVKPDQVIVLNAENESVAHDVMEWLIDLMNRS